VPSSHTVILNGCVAMLCFTLGDLYLCSPMFSVYIGTFIVWTAVLDTPNIADSFSDHLTYL